MPLSRQQSLDLLNLYPVEAVRDRWPVAKGEDLAAHVGRIADNEPDADIIAFARDRFHITKQHVYLFPFANRRLPNHYLLENNLHEERPNNAQFLIHDLQLDTFVLTDPPEMLTRHLPWPIKIEVVDGVLLARFVIMEQDAAHAHQRRTVTQRTSDDRALAFHIAHELSPDNKPIPPLDLNEGVKTLWDRDWIDALRAQWLGADSTDIRTMNKGVYLKRQPRGRGRRVYEEIMASPILKSVFAAFEPFSESIEKFACDPTGGVLYFTRYCRNNESTDNVIREILRAHR
jgi:hypothetical protein